MLIGAVFLILIIGTAISAQTTNTAEILSDGALGKILVKEKSNPVIHPRVRDVIRDKLSNEKVVVWIYFTDKGIFSKDAYQTARSEVQKTLSERAKRRRAKVNREVDFTDLPVRKEYSETVISLGARHRATTKWFNGMSVEIPIDRLQGVASLPFVREIQLVNSSKREPIKVKKGMNEQHPLRQSYHLDYGRSLGQLEQINVPAVHELGYTGEGVLVCMLDTGYNLDHEAFRHLDLIAEYDFINRDGNTANEPGDPLGQHDHGTATLSALGGSSSGQLYGPAFGASFLLAKTEDLSSETPVEEDYWMAAIEWADSIGADVASSSLIYLDWYAYEDMDGNTATITKAADMAAAKGILICNAAGNERDDKWFYIAAPADADSILACGAIDEGGLIAFFSSSGPSYDGRIKPEVVARGYTTRLAQSTNPHGYYNGSGTSFATPLVAGAAALVLEAHPNWTPMQVREALMMTADRAENPDNLYGWGIIDVLAAINYEPSQIKGDVNGDNEINVLDALMTANFIIGLIAPTPNQIWAADCNDDESINVLDVICILHIIIGDE